MSLKMQGVRSYETRALAWSGVNGNLLLLMDPRPVVLGMHEDRLGGMQGGGILTEAKMMQFKSLGVSKTGEEPARGNSGEPQKHAAPG